MLLIRRWPPEVNAPAAAGAARSRSRPHWALGRAPPLPPMPTDPPPPMPPPDAKLAAAEEAEPSPRCRRRCVPIAEWRVAIGADLTNAIGIATLAALFATSIAARLAVLAEVDCNL